MTRITEAAIIAGGLGTRLGPAAAHLPKALVDVAGEPFIFHQLRLLRRNGVERAVICAGYRGDRIQAAVGDGAPHGLRVEYSFDGEPLLGTGGALKKALPILGEAFFVLYGDSYLDCDYQAVADAFVDSGRKALITVFRNDNRWGASNVEFADGRIVRYDKKARTPAMRHIDYGLGIVTRAAFADVPADVRCDLADAYGQLLERDELAAYEVTSRFYEIGSPEGLAETRALLAGRS